MANTKWTQWHFQSLEGFCFCLVSLCFVWALKRFFDLTGPLHIYYGFWFCVFMWFFCVWICVSLWLCVLLLPFLWLPLFLLILFCPIQICLLLFYLTLLFFFFFLDACLLMRVRKDIDSGGWEDLGEIGERINCNENIMYKNLFLIKNRLG